MPRLRRVDPPHRLDLTWHQWAMAVALTAPGDEAGTRASLQGADGPAAGALAFLSVRSAFDALLSACAFAPGDEIVLTAVTIDDMPRIVRAHGLVPVPLDIDPATMAPDPAALAALCTERTRAVVVADLFGGRLDLTALARTARDHGLLVIQDLAQGFAGPGDRGDGAADVCLQSFGTLKTATALGGALAYVRDAALRRAMAEVQQAWPAQRNRDVARKLAKVAVMMLAQTVPGYSLLSFGCALAGRPVGDVVRAMTRGFGGMDAAQLLVALRHRPAPALLRMLAHRLRRFEPSRLRRRAEAGEAVVSALPPEVCPGHAQARRTHWLVPVSVAEPERLRASLLAVGLDASGASNVTAVGGVAAARLVQGLVLLPVSPELPVARRQRLVAVVLHHLENHPC